MLQNDEVHRDQKNANFFLRCHGAFSGSRSILQLIFIPTHCLPVTVHLISKYIYFLHPIVAYEEAGRKINKNRTVCRRQIMLRYHAIN